MLLLHLCLSISLLDFALPMFSSVLASCAYVCFLVGLLSPFFCAPYPRISCFFPSNVFIKLWLDSLTNTYVWALCANTDATIANTAFPCACGAVSGGCLDSTLPFCDASESTCMSMGTLLHALFTFFSIANMYLYHAHLARKLHEQPFLISKKRFFRDLLPPPFLEIKKGCWWSTVTYLTDFPSKKI